MPVGMRSEWPPWLLAVLLLVSACDSAVDPLATEWDLPERSDSAPGASALVADLTGMDLESREERVISEVLSGNVPSWLRSLQTVAFEVPDGGDWVTLKIGVLPDYLAVGSDDDYLWMPLTPQAAQRIADSSNMALPTPLIVDAVWQAASVRVSPRPIPPSPAMTTIPVFATHGDMLKAQWDSLGIVPGQWVAGHKKDVVVTARLNEIHGKVAIYGWHRVDGSPIQPVYTGHTDRWVDYSHGIRLVTRSIRADGKEVDLFDLLTDERKARWLSKDGALENPAYPNP